MPSGASALSGLALGIDEIARQVGVDLPHQIDALECPFGCQSSSAGSRLSAPNSAARAPMAARMIANAATRIPGSMAAAPSRLVTLFPVLSGYRRTDSRRLDVTCQQANTG